MNIPSSTVAPTPASGSRERNKYKTCVNIPSLATGRAPTNYGHERMYVFTLNL